MFNPNNPHPVPVSTDNVFGVVSLVFWSVTIIVTVTYVLLAMRADNDGEGGIMALITLLRRLGTRQGAQTAAVLTGLGIFGAAQFRLLRTTHHDPGPSTGLPAIDLRYRIAAKQLGSRRQQSRSLDHQPPRNYSS